MRKKNYIYKTFVVFVLITASFFILSFTEKMKPPVNGKIHLKFNNPDVLSSEKDGYLTGYATMSIENGHLSEYDYYTKYTYASEENSVLGYYVKEMRITAKNNEISKSIMHVHSLVLETHDFHLNRLEENINYLYRTSDNYDKSRMEINYYNNDNISEIIFYVYDSKKSAYVQSSKMLYDYYQDGKLRLIRIKDNEEAGIKPMHIDAIYYLYDKSNYSGFPSAEYYFFTNGKDLSGINYNYADDPSGYAIIKNKYIYVLDPKTKNIKTILKKYSSITNNIWTKYINESKYIISYDNLGNIKTIIMNKWNSKNNVWKVTRQISINGIPSGVHLKCKDLLDDIWKYILGIYD